MDDLHHAFDFLRCNGSRPTLFTQQVHDVRRKFVAGLSKKRGRAKERMISASLIMITESDSQDGVEREEKGERG